MIHRAGKLYRNADALSRRPYARDDSNYCSKVEFKEDKNIKSSIGRIVFREEFEIWKNAQLEDFSISIPYRKKETDRRSLR